MNGVRFAITETAFWPLNTLPGGYRLIASAVKAAGFVGFHMMPTRFGWLRDFGKWEDAIASYENDYSPQITPRWGRLMYQDLKKMPIPGGAMYVAHYFATPDPRWGGSAVLVSPDVATESNQYLEYVEEDGKLCFDTRLTILPAMRSSGGPGRFVAPNMVNLAPPKSVASVHVHLTWDLKPRDWVKANMEMLRSIVGDGRAADDLLVTLILKPRSFRALLDVETLSQLRSYVLMQLV